jgi:hypothetical protein
MSDYLTNLAKTLTNPKPAIRPRLGGRFEPMRLALSSMEYGGSSIKEAPHAILDASFLTPAGGDIAGPVEDRGSGVENQEAPTLDTRYSILHTRRRQSPMPSELPAARTPVERPKPVQQAPFAGRINVAGTLPRRPQQPVAAVTAVTGEQPRLPAPELTNERASAAPQSRGKPTGVSGLPLDAIPANRAEIKGVEPVSQSEATQSLRRLQPVQPVTPRQDRTALREAQAVLNPPPPDILTPFEPPAAMEAPRRRHRAPLSEAQPGTQPASIRPTVTMASAGSTYDSARPFAGVQPTQAAPTIRVTIGRVEVRATPPGPADGAPVAQPKAPRKPVVSLEEYLAQRNGDRR